MNTKYQLDSEENRQWLQQLRDELLAFGHRFPSPEGGSYYLGDDGMPWTDRPVETWITCRMAHVYSIGTFLDHEGSRELAQKALAGLQGRLKDIHAGGWYAGIKANGEPLPEKQCYAHAFVILAASSLVLAKIDGAEDLLKEALEVYDHYFWNEEEGLACDHWDIDFTELDLYRGINANMHTVEAFLGAADAVGDEKYRERAGRIVKHVVEWAAHNNNRIPEHFNDVWEPQLEFNKDRPDDPFKPYGATPGHGIEWARLTTQWALSAYPDNPEAVKPYIEAAEKMYRQAISDGWNADGEPGIVYTTGWDGKPVVHDRMHWTLAEAINTSSTLYRVTGKQEYADDYAQYMRYLDEIVHDPVNGSWYHQLDEHNKLKGTVWPGKSDLYHAFQSMIIPYLPGQDVSIAAAVSRLK